MRNTGRTFLTLLAACLLPFSPQAVSAEGHNSQATLGSLGREVTVVECPAGEVLKGFQGRKGSAIDQLQILCAPLMPDGTTGSTHAYRDAYGGFGGGPFPANACNPTSRIASAHVALNFDNSMVAGTELTCVAGDGTTAVVKFDGTDVYRGRGEYCDGRTCRHGAVADYTCPDESFTGIRIRWDSVVRGLGFLCDVRTPAVAPAKPIKSVRRSPQPASAAASGPPLVPRLSITGSWKLVANGSEHYNLLLNAQGDGMMMGQDSVPFAVVGTLASPDGSPNMAGSFSASMLPTRQLQGGYGQKNGASGNCLLNYSTDGQTLAGDCSRGKDTVRWTATRGEWPAEAAAPRVDRGALHAVTVKKTVDVYSAPGGNGPSTGQLAAGTAGVELVQACQDNWCHVRWPGHEGWVYSGPDYNSLDQ